MKTFNLENDIIGRQEQSAAALLAVRVDGLARHYWTPLARSAFFAEW